MLRFMLPVLLVFTYEFRAMAEDKTLPLFAFITAESAKDWQAVNDGVMGGVSEGAFQLTDKKTLEFAGVLSLENNGGFASIRTNSKSLALKQGDSLVVKVRGDGREYTMNLYLAKAELAFAYRAAVPTKKEEWVEVTLPLDKFEATSFGQKVADAGAVDPKEIDGLGLMLADKKAGKFKLEVESIRVLRAK